jgi:hypothetical protein
MEKVREKKKQINQKYKIEYITSVQEVPREIDAKYYEL